MTRRFSIAVLTSAILLVTGCTAADGTPVGKSSAVQSPTAEGPAQRPKIKAPTPALAPYYGQEPHWRDCGDGFECALVEVPLNYAKPSGERIKISVIRLPATGERLGSLLINPGGPGGSGIQYAQAARSIITAKVRKRFDIVGFDPRGVGESTPIRCRSGSQLDSFQSLDASPDSDAEITALENGAKAFAAGCEATSSRLLPFVGTANAARDMDVLRGVLRDPGLTYLGKSYGTYLGAIYADLFPKQVRALVLDGAVDPAAQMVEMNQTQARGFEVALKAFIEDCFKHDACPFTSRTVDGALREISDLLKKADERPLKNGLGDGRQINESWAVVGIVAPLYEQDAWPVLQVALGHAFAGDGTDLLRMADLLIERRSDGSYTNLIESNLAINCVDHPYPKGTPTYEKAARAAAKTAPHFGEYIMWGSLPCSYWPVKSTGTDKPVTAAGAPPILVVGTERDPATPYEWAESLASELSSGVLLGFDGDGHTAYKTGSDCVDSAVDDYLISLKVPANGTVCPKIG